MHALSPPAMALLVVTAMAGFASEPDDLRARSASRPLCIVITGESNSGGLGLNQDATAAELMPRPAVQIMNLTSGTYAFEDLRIGVNNLRKHRRLADRESTCHGFELELANAVEEGAFAGQRQVRLIKTGQGGSLVRDWAEGRPDWEEFRLRIAAGRKQMPAGTRWVIWLSLGINDAIAGTKDWKSQMASYLPRLQQELPGASIVMTGFQSMGYAAIDQAIVELASEHRGIRAIDSTGAGLADRNHWNYAGLKLVTRRLIAATVEALAQPDPARP